VGPVPEEAAFMADFFDFSGFPPRWQCGAWPPELGWLTILSDLTIFAAYTAIPVTIAIYVRRRRDVLFPHVFWLFVAFIFFCGTTHLIEAIIFWHPIYPVQGVLKFCTAVISIAAVVATARIMPAALALPGMVAMNQRLQSEVAAHSLSQRELRALAGELQESQCRLLAAQAAARLGDWSYDPATQHISWSAEVFRLHQRDPALGPPASWAENLTLYTPHGAEDLTAAIERIHAGEQRIALDLEVLLPSGTAAWHQAIIHSERDADGKVRRLWGTVQDITSKKLETLENDRRHQELRRINQQLEQFAYIASHDLLEPLRKMRFFADVVEEDARGKLSADGADALRRFSAASERMSRLVKDVLAFARAGKSLTEPRPVDLTAVAREAIENLDAQIRDHRATISVGELSVVQGDAGLLCQVFQNLLANAIRYRHAERPPRIEISALRAGNAIEITVRDNGIGFDPAQVSRLFQPFVRLHPGVSSEGTGIGLAICRRIIEAHNGTILASAGVPCGAVFAIFLPATEGART
jgi:signal transduction histidine kinase